jgi:AcrR family transcriptional regulator
VNRVKREANAGEPATWETLPLRERKLAQTRLALFETAMDRIAVKPFAEVTVKELCAATSLSEPTFFNYFPKRIDLLVYYVALWSLDVQSQIARLGDRGRGLRAIEHVFEMTSREIRKRPHIIYEIITWKALSRVSEPWPAVSRAERLLRFPDRPEILALDVLSVNEIFDRHLRAAVVARELPKGLDVPLARISLVSIFYGVPLALGIEKHAAVGATYKRALAQLWAGTRSAAPPAAP